MDVSTTTDIPLAHLFVSPLNARKTAGASIESLAASIHAHGLLQNLVVKADGEHRFTVVAGGQRRHALQHLVDTGLLLADYKAPCRVLHLDDRGMVEASLAENVIREDMHPADEFNAFAAVIDQGHALGEVAARFGKTEIYVKQRLKLANVAPQIMRRYRVGEADLEQMMALALTDDQALQCRLWKAAKSDWQRRPDLLRKAITEKELSTQSKIGKFIGLDAYEKAGGTVRRDLFAIDGEAFMQDAAIVMQVCLSKLERTAEKVRKEGWLWVEAHPEIDYSERQAFGHAQATYKGSKQTWPADVKSTAGAMIHIGHNGQAEIARGLVRPQDRKAAAKAGGADISGGKAAKPARVPGEISFAAMQRLQAEATGILRNQIAGSRTTALALLAAELAGKALYTVDGYATYGSSREQRQWIHIQRDTSGRMPGNFRDVIPATAAGKAFQGREAAWKAMLPQKKMQLREWLLLQTGDVVVDLLAFLAAREIDVVDVFPNSKQGAVDLAAAAKVDIKAHWAPTAEWLATLPKAVVIAMVNDAAGKVAAAPLAKLKKAQLPAAAIGMFPKGWLPTPLRQRSPTKKARTKASSAK